MRRRTRASSPLLASVTSKPRTPSVVRRLRLSAESSSTISSLPGDSFISGTLAQMRQCEEQCRSCLQIAFNPNPAAVCFSNPFGHGQTDTSSRCFMLRPWGPVKTLKDPQSLFRRDEGAFVLNAHHDLCVSGLDTDSDWRRWARVF